MLEFRVSAEDYLTIQSLLNTNSMPKLRDVVMSLLNRPSLIRWILFWKIFVKSAIGNHKYLALKQFTHN